jgi:hypothetical protein
MIDHELKVERCRRAIDDILAPMLDAERAEELIETRSSVPVAWHQGQTALKLAPDDESDDRIVIERTPPFADEEKRLCEIFLDEFRAIANLSEMHYRELERGLAGRLAARYLSAKHPSAILGIIHLLSNWASQTYEGSPVTAALGFDPNNGGDGEPLALFEDQPFVKVLSNGFDTQIVVNAAGQVVGHEQLNDPRGTMPRFTPYRLGAIAHWTTQKKNRTAFVLNRRSEILALTRGRLLFAKRSGRWNHYLHETLLTKFNPPTDSGLRTALYESCLDVSFARTGGCLSVVRGGTSDEDIAESVAAQDVIDLRESSKSRMLGDVIGGRTFQELDRRLRQELLAIDGACVLRHTGHFVTAGAIVEVPSGSTSGGRLAAAMALSHLGLGIKISEDGEIRGFANGKQRFVT